ncbi:MAG: GTPase EngC [Acidimicrobiales bacterium]|nr:GTPase EngC [Acidimicrobiales bacterium]
MTALPSLSDYGWDDHWSSRLDDLLASPAAAEIDGPVPGRVVRHDGAGLIVTTADGPRRAMFGPPVTPPPVVGDWVVLDRSNTPQATLPRDSLLRRRAAGGEKEQPLVANVDVVLVVCGLDRPVRSGRIQRTITIALDAGAESLLVLTKADKVDPSVAAEAELIAAEVDPDLEVVTLSAKGGWGIDDLLARVGHRTLALIGESGAGKSTLVNALMEADVADTAGVREGDSKGRHTTTYRELHLLAGGGVLVDTPGIREVGVWVDPDAVTESFPDIEELAESCRFRDCKHDAEPGCAVQQAVADGTLSKARLDQWRSLEAEAASVALRADAVEHRRRNRQFGRIAREAQQAKDDQRNR